MRSTTALGPPRLCAPVEFRAPPNALPAIAVASYVTALFGIVMLGPTKSVVDAVATHDLLEPPALSDTEITGRVPLARVAPGTIVPTGPQVPMDKPDRPSAAVANRPGLPDGAGVVVVTVSCVVNCGDGVAVVGAAVVVAITLVVVGV
ncbi:hypothetical protein P9209_02760 [Prescottella defluvii]|nr:hypothetical protein P9209_02760 [Prescottella defluvii]